MVLTRSELIAAFQNEARILSHLLGKIDPRTLDYRPGPKQRSMSELVNYLSMMGPALVRVALAGAFERPVWNAAEQQAAGQTFDQAVDAIAAHAATYEGLLGAVDEARFRDEIEVLNIKAPRGAILVSLALCHCAAYRTQLFLYLKAAGREELSTSNLWFGVDPAPKGAA